MGKIDLAKTYDAAKFEDKIYETWESSGLFNPDNLNVAPEAKSYTIILPPPNITDKLHLGHAEMLAIEDLFIRYKRMQGFRTLWLPGTDHAAIATQTVVEKRIKQSEHKTRHDLGREEFLKRVWAFLRETQDIILKQIRVMGASLDWSRLAFTLDDERRAAVKEMFVQMYEEDLIYRGERIVNWCPNCRSTLADDEVDYKEQAAKLYTFRYDADFPISIATTRPETKLGDTAVAVNPSDKRYQQYIGQTLSANFCGVDLKLKVIADRNVDMAFGTGALGVTPAHSMVDWQMAEANDLEIIKVIDEHGLIREGFGELSGLKAEAAREIIVENLRADGLMIKEEDISNNLSLCYRCGTPIEPLPSKQWFIAVDKPVERLGNKSLKQAAIAAADKIEFLPERFTKRYLDWMNNLRDWCISRQIWFGHELPVWYKGEEVFVGRDKPEGDDWLQDTDTLDTWFSSGMWTFSTLGWPNKTDDLAKFHPTQLMETGYEIITLWVSRMIMMSLFAVGQVPFEKVYLHGMVLDKHGKKMSKSKGNGIDPLDMVKLYGADAVRLSLLIGTTPGTDFRISEDKIASYRNFVNKFWNIARFIASQIEEAEAEPAKPTAKTLADNWILGEMERLIVDTDNGLENYDFSWAGKRLEEFTWNELADWYLEIAKIEGDKSAILNYILNNLLKLWHPFMPFATEVIWQEIFKSKSVLMIQSWPEVDKKWLKNLNEVKNVENIELNGEMAVYYGYRITMEKIKNLIIGIRNARSANKIAPTQKIKAVIYAPSGTDIGNFEENSALIKGLKTGIGELVIERTGDKIAEAIYFGSGGLEVYLLAEVDTAKEKVRLEKEFVNLEEYITKLEAELDNQEFIAKAPPALVEKKKQNLAQTKTELEKIKERLSNS